MQNANEKYPILTAWLGIMAVLAIATVILSLALMNASSTASAIFMLFFVVFGGYIVFKLMIEHHILNRFDGKPVVSEAQRSLVQRLSLPIAWVSFLLLDAVPTFFIQQFAALFPYLLTFLISFFLGIFVGYFIFAFVVNRLVVSLYTASPLR